MYVFAKYLMCNVTKRIIRSARSDTLDKLVGTNAEQEEVLVAAKTLAKT